MAFGGDVPFWLTWTCLSILQALSCINLLPIFHSLFCPSLPILLFISLVYLSITGVWYVSATAWMTSISPYLISMCPMQDEMALRASEGWEYAPLFNMKFHAKEAKMDLVRRRRWHRRMVSTGPEIKPCFFAFDGDSSVRVKNSVLSLFGIELVLVIPWYRSPNTYHKPFVQ